jgi:hypothetical protein
MLPGGKKIFTKEKSGNFCEAFARFLLLFPFPMAAHLQ